VIDIFAILSSSLLILYVLIRAVRMDRSLPWFEGDTPSDAQHREGEKAASGQVDRYSNKRS
jgi:hypothetical protein